MMIYRSTLAAIAVVVIVTGCAAPKSLLDKRAALEEKTSVAIRSMPDKTIPVTDQTLGTAAAAQALAAKTRPVARYAKKAWHGTRMADVQDDSVLPPIFSEKFALNFDDRATNGRVSLAIVAERLSRISGVPVRIKADVYQMLAMPPAAVQIRSAGAPLPPSMPIPSGTPTEQPKSDNEIDVASEKSVNDGFQETETSVLSVEMRWNGTLAAFLDHLTGRLNLSWSYRDGAVILERFITESFEVAAFGGSQNYKMGLNSGNTSSGGGETSGSATSTLDLSESGKVSALESLKASITALVQKSGGSVVLNEATGRFFVTATKDVMGRVRQLVQTEDAAMQRQAHIQFDIYSVITNDSDEAGVDWSVFYQDLAGKWGASIVSPATLTSASTSSLGINIISAGPSDLSKRFGSSSALINLLNQVGNSAMYRPVSMIAMNRQWARKTNLKVNGYVSETTPSTASSAGSGSVGLKTASITTGDKFMVMPAILDSGAISLKFGISLTELLGLFDVTAGSGDTLQKVQTPETSGTDDQGTVQLKPGQAMVVTGLSRRLSSNDRRALSADAPILLGGSRKDQITREEFVIVVRASQI